MTDLQLSARGRLANDPRPIQTKSGTAMTVATLAVNLPVSRTEETATQWLSLTAFGKTAELLARHGKGDLVSVAGNVQIDRWQKDGEQIDRLAVILDSLISARTP
jgi:single-stranded DNA-binding protein